MAYPEKVTDLNPDQLVSRPVVYESFSASPLPREQAVAYCRPRTASEADKALKIAQDDWVRLSEQYDRALKDPSQFTPSALSEINGWAVRENKTPIASDPGCLR